MTEDLRELSIGEVAARAGMTPSRIRYYEQRGLLPMPERTAGQRRYTADVFRRLSIIDAAQRVGFTLDEIQDLLGSRYAACSMIGHLLDFNLGLGATVCAGPIRRVSR
jgi:DNA-binding transcriptional MerR regulator